MDARPIGHRVSLLVDQNPRHIAREAMTGVVPGRFGERELMGDPVEGVATVANPVRPGDQVLPRPAVLISSTPNPRTTSRPSTEKLRSVAPTSVTTARWVPEMISYCSPVGAALTNWHFIR